MQKRPYLHTDTECYPNYWAIGFVSDDDPQKTYSFVKYNDSPLDIQSIVNLIASHTIITFNGNHYDEPMILYALAGASNAQLYELNEAIIVGKLKPWEVTDNYLADIYNEGERGYYGKMRYVRPRWLDHVDIIGPTPGVNVSLKIYMGRIHSRTMQSLPIEPGTVIRDEDLQILEDYRKNDESGTLELFDSIRGRIELREAMSKRFNLDLRSKSDPQIAEAVLYKQLGYLPDKQEHLLGQPFRYHPPAWVAFQTPGLRSIFATVKAGVFTTTRLDMLYEDTGEFDDNGKAKKKKSQIVMPDEIKKCNIEVGEMTYKFGIGGLHSKEKSRSIHAKNGWTLTEHDAASFYPKTIINERYYPEHIGPVFLDIYGGMMNDRLNDKANAALYEGQPEHSDLYKHYKTGDESLKIVINGLYGKLGSRYSRVFAPSMMIHTTITGQLALLMLIESLYLAGVDVVSANTDGIMVQTAPGLEEKRDKVIRDWEKTTGHTMDKKSYSSVYSADVNNYIAITTDGKIKRKGRFAPVSLMKSPSNLVCVDAVVKSITEGIPIDETIRAEKDIRKFVTIRAVNKKGGAVWEGENLGKAIRWYYSTEVDGAIHYADNGNKVASSDGARPVMVLPDELPSDLDYAWYIKTAEKMLLTTGALM